MGYLLLALIIVGAVFAFITVRTINKKDKEISLLKSQAKGLRDENGKLVKSNSTLSQNLKESNNQLQLANQKLEQQPAPSEGLKAKEVIMYREASVAEKERGLDYKYMQTFASYRQAQGMTGINRRNIAQSVNHKKYVKHPKKDHLVIFALSGNTFKSDEKLLG